MAVLGAAVVAGVMVMVVVLNHSRGGSRGGGCSFWVFPIAGEAMVAASSPLPSSVVTKAADKPDG